MVLARQLAIGLFDRLLVRIWRNTENLLVILEIHICTASPLYSLLA
jgi:hypothetical protein